MVAAVPPRRDAGGLDVSAGGPSTLYRLLPPDGGAPGAVTRDADTLVVSPRPASLLGRLVWAINQQVINGSSDRLLLHAGAVDLDGVGVLIPAAMESGKTTLVTGLLDRGFGYLTDEAASVTAELVLEGYPKPLSIDQGSWEILAHHRPAVGLELVPYLKDQWQVPAQDISRVISGSRLGLIVFRGYVEGAETRLERLTPASALGLAIESTFVTDRPHLSEQRLKDLAVIAERIPAYELVGGDLDEACQAVLGALGSVAGEAAPGH
jgi:hypothetical protein